MNIETNLQFEARGYCFVKTRVLIVGSILDVRLLFVGSNQCRDELRAGRYTFADALRQELLKGKEILVERMGSETQSTWYSPCIHDCYTFQ